MLGCGNYYQPEQLCSGSKTECIEYLWHFIVFADCFVCVLIVWPLQLIVSSSTIRI